MMTPLPKRLENALKKLYLAFHENRLNPEDCRHCAVGNICDNNDSWKHFTTNHGSIELSYLGKIHEALGRKLQGYSPRELLQIEAIFLKACGYSFTVRNRLVKPAATIDKDMIFKGMNAVVAHLCSLDGVKNVMEQPLVMKRPATSAQPILNA